MRRARKVRSRRVLRLGCSQCEPDTAKRYINKELVSTGSMFQKITLVAVWRIHGKETSVK